MSSSEHRFCLIKPSHYDDDGYVIQWFRSAIPLQLYRVHGKLKKDPGRFEYMDLAITPVTDDEIETREMFQTEEARNYVVKIQRVEKMRSGAIA